MKQKDLSKLMSYILRHKPEKFNLQLGEQGFISLTDFYNAITAKHTDVTWSDILEAVYNYKDKKRFEIKGDKIRALHGHTTASHITYEPITPPHYLYHGTSRRAWETIKYEGLKPMKREYVHLTDQLNMANEIGSRYDHKPVILVVDTTKINGEIYNSENGIFLTKVVPVDAIELNDNHKDGDLL